MRCRLRRSTPELADMGATDARCTRGTVKRHTRRALPGPDILAPSLAVGMANQLRNRHSGFCQVDAHAPDAAGRGSTAVAVLTIGRRRAGGAGSRSLPSPHASSRWDSRSHVVTRVMRRKANCRHMTSDPHGRASGEQLRWSEPWIRFWPRAGRPAPSDVGPPPASWTPVRSARPDRSG